MKHPTNIQPSSAKAAEGGHPTSIVLALLLMAASALALPQPIRNGVLTGTLNANRQAVTNVGTLTFTDGTTLATAAVGGTVNTNAFTGTVTNLSPPTVAYSTNTFIQVSGSGLAPVNDNTYATNASFGSAYGHPIYVNASQTEQILFWEAAPFGLQAGQSGWIIATNGFDQNGNTPVYFLAEGTAATPDLAANWLSVLADGGGNLNPNPINNPPPTVVAVVTVSTNWVRHFNIATFTNGVCVTNTHGSIMNPIRHPAGSAGNAPIGFTGMQTNFITIPVQVVVTATPVSTFSVFGLTVSGAGTTNADGDYSWDYGNNDYTNVTAYGGNDGANNLLTGLFTNVIFEVGGFTSTNTGSNWELLGGDGQDLYDEGISPVGPYYTAEEGETPVPTLSYNSTVFVVTNYTYTTNLVFGGSNLFSVVTFSNGVCKTNWTLTYSTGQTLTLPTPVGNVQYGGPMMFDYAYGGTNILSDGVGDLLIQDGGSIYVNNNDSQGFGPGNEYLNNGSPMTTIGSGTITCVGGGGYAGGLVDSTQSTGAGGQLATANGDGTWTWDGTLNVAGLSVNAGGVTNTLGNVVVAGIAAEVVSGASVAGANDTYNAVGQINGRPGYQASSGNVVEWGGGYWAIMELDDYGWYSPIYYSDSDTPTPDLATDWMEWGSTTGVSLSFTAIPAGFVGNGSGLTGLSAAQISGLGNLAFTNTVAASLVTGLGSLALSNMVPASKLTGLGNLAFSNSVPAALVSGLGSLAYSNSTAGLNLVVTNTWNGAQTRTYITNGLAVKFTAP